MAEQSTKLIPLALTHNQRWFIVFLLYRALGNPDQLIKDLEARVGPRGRVDYEAFAKDMSNLITQLVELKKA